MNSNRRYARDQLPLLGAVAARAAAGAGEGGLLGRVLGGGFVGGGGGGKALPNSENDFTGLSGEGDEQTVEDIGPEEILKICVVAFAKFDDTQKQDLADELHLCRMGNGHGSGVGLRVLLRVSVTDCQHRTGDTFAISPFVMNNCRAQNRFSPTASV